MHRPPVGTQDQSPGGHHRGGEPGAWREVVPGVFRYVDSCNVYAVIRANGALIIDSGSGHWLKHLDELPTEPSVLICTHFFRDHSAGAAAAAAQGIAVYVPEWEEPLYRDPLFHFQQRESFTVYENYWHHFAPVEPIPCAGVLRDYERRTLAGVDIEIVPLPGASIGQIGVLVAAEDGARHLFCGELIHSRGRLPRIAPLQYGYDDHDGVPVLFASLRSARNVSPDALFPSMGEPMLEDADGALKSLEDSLKEAFGGRFDMSTGPRTTARRRLDPGPDRVDEIGPHVWQSSQGCAISTFLVSESGKALALDYGFNEPRVSWELVDRPTTSRPLLHSVDALREATGATIEVVIPTHYHDDHVAGIPVLQRLFGVECWAAESFAHILAQPDGSAFPCTWHVPIAVQRVLPMESTQPWREYVLHIGPHFSGHTAFAALTGFEAGGVRYAHTGDQYINGTAWDPAHVLDWARDDLAHVEVYRNRMELDGYHRSARWLLEWRPDVVITGHGRAFAAEDRFFERVRERAEQLEELHTRLMPLGDDEAHFGPDSYAGWVWPYRTFLPRPGRADVTVTLLNPLPRTAEITARLVVPRGWSGDEVTLTVGPRARAECPLSFEATWDCRRRPIAVEIEVEGRCYGQIAEALVTVGGDYF